MFFLGKPTTTIVIRTYPAEKTLRNNPAPKTYPNAPLEQYFPNYSQTIIYLPFAG
jgi:hypothetical protein